MTSAKTAAYGQTSAERKLDIDRLEAVLQGMIIMLRDNPDLPVPWTVDISCDLSEPEFERFLEHHPAIKPFDDAPWIAYLAPLAERYSAKEDRGDLYLPWSLGIKREDRPL